jgi:hypothetical protein
MLTMERSLFINRVAILLIVLNLLGVTARSEVRLIRKIPFASHHAEWSLLDLYGRFGQQALALSPAGDLLTFSSRPNGVWELYRVHEWNTETPSVDHLQLPGYFSSQDRHDIENLDVNVYITPNGAFAVCVGSAEWLKRVHGWAVDKAKTDSIITIIDLTTFKIINSVRTKAVDPYEFQSVNMDGEGRIVITSSSFHTRNRNEFIQLEVPSLHSGSKCVYDTFQDKQYKEHVSAVTVEDCNRDLNSKSLEDYVFISVSNLSTSTKYVCKDIGAEYCPQPELFTPDQRFGIGIESEGHDNIFGSWVQTRAMAIFFSNNTHNEIGELDMTHQPAYLKLASVDGMDYSIIIRSGSELDVYELLDSDFAKK